MFEPLHKQLITTALAEAPNEMCGYIVDTGNGIQFHQCTNTIPHKKEWGLDPREAFAISIEERLRVELLGDIVAIVHSHTEANQFNGKLTFSAIDRAACNRGTVPWILVTLPDKKIQVLEPAQEVEPLLGRSFHYGIFDCYSLIRDAMAEAGVYLNDYARSIAGEWDTDDSWDLYTQNFTREGFIEVDRFSPLQKFDLLLMHYGARRRVINHAAIVMDVEHNIFYHHAINKLSTQEVFCLNDGSQWDKATVKVIRHQSLIQP